MDESSYVSGQVLPVAAARLHADGYRLLVNNRPDDEEPGQPSSAEMQAAAHAAGLQYVHLPVAGGLSRELIEETRAALAAADGKVLMFCKSGMRSALLWAAARAADGMPVEDALAAAERAGLGLRPYRPMLEQAAAAFRDG